MEYNLEIKLIFEDHKSQCLASVDQNQLNDWMSLQNIPVEYQQLFSGFEIKYCSDKENFKLRKGESSNQNDIFIKQNKCYLKKNQNLKTRFKINTQMFDLNISELQDVLTFQQNDFSFKAGLNGSDQPLKLIQFKDSENTIPICLKELKQNKSLFYFEKESSQCIGKFQKTCLRQLLSQNQDKALTNFLENDLLLSGEKDENIFDLSEQFIIIINDDPINTNMSYQLQQQQEINIDHEMELYINEQLIKIKFQVNDQCQKNLIYNQQLLESQIEKLRQQKSENENQINDEVQQFQKEFQQKYDEKQELLYKHKQLLKETEKYEEKQKNIESSLEKVQKTLNEELKNQQQTLSQKQNQQQDEQNPQQIKQDQELQTQIKQIQEFEYDIQIKFDSVRDICTYEYDQSDKQKIIKGGFEVKIKDDLQKKDENQQKGISVGIIGHFKKGKTWLLQQLLQMQIESSKIIRTTGINLIKHNSAFFYDTQGADEPLQIYEKLKEVQMERNLRSQVRVQQVEESQQLNQNPQLITKFNNQEIIEEQINKIKQGLEKEFYNNYNENKMHQQFIEKFIILNCQAVIVVVSSYNIEEERYLNSIIETCQNYMDDKNRSQDNKIMIFVVHNYFMLSEIEDVKKKIRKDILYCFDVEKNGEEITEKSFLNKNHLYYDKVKIKHLVTALENTEAGRHYNQDAIETINVFIRGQVEFSSTSENLSNIKSVPQLMKQFLHTNIFDFLAFNSKLLQQQQTYLQNGNNEEQKNNNFHIIKEEQKIIEEIQKVHIDYIQDQKINRIVWYQDNQNKITIDSSQKNRFSLKQYCQTVAGEIKQLSTQFHYDPSVHISEFFQRGEHKNGKKLYFQDYVIEASSCSNLFKCQFIEEYECVFSTRNQTKDKQITSRYLLVFGERLPPIEQIQYKNSNDQLQSLNLNNEKYLISDRRLRFGNIIFKFDIKKIENYEICISDYLRSTPTGDNYKHVYDLGNPNQNQQQESNYFKYQPNGLLVISLPFLNKDEQIKMNELDKIYFQSSMN